MMPRCARSLRPALGFTLIEMVLVIIIVGILAVASFSRLPGTTLTLGAQTDQMAADARLVQSLEMTHGVSYCLNVTQSGYQITTAQCTTAIASPASGATTTSFGAGITASTNLPNGYLAFMGAGVPYVSQTQPLTSPAVITLTAGGQSRTVSIAPETGHVSVP